MIQDKFKGEEQESAKADEEPSLICDVVLQAFRPRF